MARPTFHQQVKKQKERARKARQEEKQQRRSVRTNAVDAGSEGSPIDAGAPRDPNSETAA